MVQIGFYFDQSRCIGCYTCSVACKDWHDINAGPINWRQVKIIEKGKFPNPFLVYLSYSCNHCENPPCIQVCPGNAIIKIENNGVVIVDYKKCLGTNNCDQNCLHVCPWNCPQFGLEANAKMQKCDLCYNRLKIEKKPICVEACPMYALDSGPMEELREKYGGCNEAQGFIYSKKFNPSVIFKPKN